MRARTSCAMSLVLAATSPAFAQTQPRAPHDQPIRNPYITRSGATVDKPGEPQGSAPTPLDRHIQKQDNAIDGSICKGC